MEISLFQLCAHFTLVITGISFQIPSKNLLHQTANSYIKFKFRIAVHICKADVLKNFAILREKHLCQSIFSIKWDSSTGAFWWILQKLFRALFSVDTSSQLWLLLVEIRITFFQIMSLDVVVSVSVSLYVTVTRKEV